ncbi:MAG: M23 family peptidase, partial [Bacteroidia bacterium]|nr:M23 family peptidase [Bacteroidia bacterium]
AGINENGNKWSEGGDWENNMVTTKTRVFGNFYIDIDTIPPKIKPLNIYENKDMGRNDRIKIRIKDNFSGIKSYKGTIDGKWVLMEYDAKNSLLTHYFDTRTATGEHTFVIKVIDKKGNSSKYSVVFNR